jgi:hypothetical protein
MTLDASGNLGLGSGLSFTSWSNSGNIDLNDVYLSLSSAGTYGGVIANNAYYNGGWKYKAANYANLYQTTSGEHKWLTAGVGTAGNAISFTQAMTLNASGNLSIGNTNDTYKLDVNGTGRFSGLTQDAVQTVFRIEGKNASSQVKALDFKLTAGTPLWTISTAAVGTDAGINIMPNGNAGLSLAYSTGAATFSSSVTAGGGVRTTGANGFSDTDGTSTIWVSANWTASTPAIAVTTNHPLMFLTNNTERMRIRSSGEVLVNTASLGTYGKFSSYTNDGIAAGRFVSGPSTADGSIVLMVDKYSTTNTTSQWFLGFTINNQGTASGVITANGASQAAFGSWSDFRLKENITNLPSQLDKIMSLRPVEFDYIKSEGGGHQISFIAQEFEKVFPDAVGQRADGMKTLTGWGKTEAILVKAIQELKQELDTLKNK